MSIADDVLGRYASSTDRSASSPSYARPDDDDEFVNSILSKYTQETSQPEEGIFSKGLHAVGSVLGAPKAGIDYLARAGARAQGLNVPDDATTGTMMRNALGFNQGYESSGFGSRVGGGAVQLATDVATDPVTWAMGGLGGAARGGSVAESVLSKVGADVAPEIATALQGAVKSGNLARPVQRGAEAAFLATLAPGAIQSGTQTYGKYQKEGFTPDVAEGVFNTAAMGLGALGVGAHFLHKGALPEVDAVRRNVQGEPNPENLTARLSYYEKRGQTDFADIVRSEMEHRKGTPKPTVPLETPEGQDVGLRAAEAQAEPTATPRTSSYTQPMNISWIDEIAKATDRHPEVDAATPEQAKAAVDAVAGPAEEAAARVVAPEPQAPPLAQIQPETRQASLSRVQELVDGGMSLEEAKQVAAKEAAPAGTKEVTVEGTRREVQVSPEQAQELADAEARYRRTVEAIQANRLGGTVKGAGMEWAAEKRRITGQLTDKEQQAKTAFDARIRPGDTVQGPDGREYQVKSPPAYGKVKVVDANGNEFNLAHGDLVKGEQRGPVPAVTEPVSPERGVSPVEGPLDAIARGDDGNVAGPEAAVIEPTGVPAPAVDALRQPAQAEPLAAPVEPLPVPPVGASDTIPFPSKPPNPARVAMEAEVLRQRPNLDRAMVKAVFDDVEAGKRPVEATVNALLKMDPRTGPAPFRGWEGHLFEAKDQPSSLPPEKQAALRGVVEAAPPEATDWIKESNEAARVAEEARTERQDKYDAKKAEKQAERDAAAEELEPQYSATEKPAVSEPPVPQAKATLADVQANFKGHKVEATPEGFVVSLPGGRKVVVENTGHIDMNPGALERGHGPAAVTGVSEGTQQLVGSYRRVGPDSMIQVVEKGALPHEVWHAWEEHVATPKERRIANQEFTTRAKAEGRAVGEVAADSYREYFEKRQAAEAKGESYAPKNFIERMWSRVHEFFRNAYRSIFPNVEHLQKQLYEGKPWERGVKEGEAGTGGPQYATTPPVVPPAAPTQGPPKPPATLAEKGLEAWKSGLISGPGTILVANPLSNVGEAGVRGIESAVAGPVDAALTHWFGGDRTRFSGEAVKQAQGIIPRLPGAFKVLGDRLKNVLNSSGKIEGKKGQIIRVPFQLLDAGDATTAHVNEGVVSKGLAYREGQRLGKTAAEKTRIENDLLQNPTADFTKQVNREVQRRQWKGDPEDPVDMIGKFSSFISQHPLLQVVAPFIRTPGEIAKVAIQRSPLGIFKAVADVKTLKAAIAKGASPETISKLKGEATDSISRAMVGTTILGAFAAYAKAGGMTGSGPTDQKQKSLLRETGWQPYSFVVNAGGKKAYIPFNRFEPVSTILGLSADLAEAKDQKNGEEVANKVIGSIASNITSKTYLQGIADAAEFINDPMKAGKSYLSSLTSSLIPNIVAKTAQAIDPTLRDVTPESSGIAGLGERLSNTVLSRLPGASMTLPARKSATGEEVERPGNAVSRFLSPIQISEEKQGTELEKALVDLGYVPSQPSREIKIPGKNVKVRLTDSEYTIVQTANTEASKYLRDNLSRIKALPKEEQEKAARKIYDRARESARNRLFASPSFRARAKSEVANARQS